MKGAETTNDITVLSRNSAAGEKSISKERALRHKMFSAASICCALTVTQVALGFSGEQDNSPGETHNPAEKVLDK